MSVLSAACHKHTLVHKQQTANRQLSNHAPCKHIITSPISDPAPLPNTSLKSSSRLLYSTIFLIISHTESQLEQQIHLQIYQHKSKSSTPRMSTTLKSQITGTDTAAKHAGFNDFPAFLLAHGLKLSSIEDVKEGRAILRAMGYGV